MRLSFLILVFAVFFNACNESSTNSGTTANTIDTTTVLADTVHNSMTPVDWMGAYEGTLQLDGKRSKVYIELEEEGNWISKVGKEEQRGKFEWLENGSVVQLKGVTNMPDKFLVGENFIMQLEKDGHRISDDLDGIYTLNKIN